MDETGAAEALKRQLLGILDRYGVSGLMQVFSGAYGPKTAFAILSDIAHASEGTSAPKFDPKTERACAICGKVFDRNGTNAKYCSNLCKRIAVGRRKAGYDERRRGDRQYAYQERRTRGLCAWCGKPIENPGKTHSLCEECYTKVRAHDKRGT